MNWEDAKKRATIINNIRQFFAERDVVEVETPLLSAGTVTDVHLDAFSTTYAFNSVTGSTLYLQTSPEFAMKRLLSSGYQSIYQLGKAFRNEDYGNNHNPEFTMLEWYRIGFDHHQLINEVSELLITILQCEQPSIITYQEAFLSVLSIDPLEASIDELKSFVGSKGDLADWLVEDHDKDTLLQFMFASYIECVIGVKAPVIVYDFPASQASLAKISQDDPRVAERFEVYYKGVELANGFNELTNALEQEERFKRDNLQRRSKGLEEKPIDHRFLEALISGIPNCAGVALGVDRLIMLALEKNTIEEVMTFSVGNA